MPTTSAVSGGSSATSSANTVDAFRNADFLKIMLSELTSQDPFQPQETSKLVENVQKLQDLANTTYTKFRADLTWAQQLMGQTVQVQQQSLTEAEKKKQTDEGLKPDVGYGSVNGRVTSFRVINQQVFVTVNDHDYPMDNVKQLVPSANSGSDLAAMADRLLGKQIAWLDESGASKSGKVTAVRYAPDGSVVVQAAGEAVPFDKIVQIGVE